MPSFLQIRVKMSSESFHLKLSIVRRLHAISSLTCYFVRPWRFVCRIYFRNNFIPFWDGSVLLWGCAPWRDWGTGRTKLGELFSVHEALSTKAMLSTGLLVLLVSCEDGRGGDGGTNCSITFAAVSLLGVRGLDWELVLCVQVWM